MEREGWQKLTRSLDYFAEIEAALQDDNITLMAIPTEMVPEVLALISTQEQCLKYQ